MMEFDWVFVNNQIRAIFPGKEFDSCDLTGEDVDTSQSYNLELGVEIRTCGTSASLDECLSQAEEPPILATRRFDCKQSRLTWTGLPADENLLVYPQVWVTPEGQEAFLANSACASVPGPLYVTLIPGQLDSLPVFQLIMTGINDNTDPENRLNLVDCAQ